MYRLIDVLRRRNDGQVVEVDVYELLEGNEFEIRRLSTVDVEIELDRLRLMRRAIEQMERLTPSRREAVRHVLRNGEEALDAASAPCCRAFGDLRAELKSLIRGSRR